MKTKGPTHVISLYKGLETRSLIFLMCDEWEGFKQSPLGDTKDVVIVIKNHDKKTKFL